MNVEPSEAVVDFTATLAVLRYELASRRTASPSAELDTQIELIESLQMRQQRAVSAVEEVREETRLIASMPRTASVSAASPSSPSLPITQPSQSYIERRALSTHPPPAPSTSSAHLLRLDTAAAAASARAASNDSAPLSPSHREALAGYTLSPKDPLTADPPPAALSPTSRSRGAAWFNMVSKASAPPAASPPSLPSSPSTYAARSSESLLMPLPSPSPSPRSAPLSASQPTRSPRSQTWTDALSTLSTEAPPASPDSFTRRTPAASSSSSLSSASSSSSSTLPTTLLNALLYDDPFKSYTQTTRLGAGGLAEVFRCTPLVPTLRAAVAFKIYAPRIPGGSAAQVEQVANELDVFMHCKHPNLVTYYSAYLWRERVYVAVELCEAGSLLTLYKNAPVPETAIAYCVGELLAGLGYLHLHNRLHRDIKAENVLLTATGEVKIADFGTAQEVPNAFAPGPTTAPIVGTRYFMAPEMIRAEGYCSRADIWSVGCVLLELANRQIPYAELRSVRALLRIASVGAPWLKHPSRFSAAMHDALRKLTAFQWRDRPSAVQALAVRVQFWPGRRTYFDFPDALLCKAP